MCALNKTMVSNKTTKQIKATVLRIFQNAFNFESHNETLQIQMSVHVCTVFLCSDMQMHLAPLSFWENSNLISSHIINVEFTTSNLVIPTVKHSLQLTKLRMLLNAFKIRRLRLGFRHFCQSCML